MNLEPNSLYKYMGRVVEFVRFDIYTGRLAP